KIKIEAPPTSTTPPTPDTSSPIGVSSIVPPTSVQTLTVANILTPKPNSAPPVISVNQNGFCPVPTSLNLHQSFVADMTQSHICSTVLPSPLLPTSFPGNQFLAYSACPSVPASCSGPVPQTFIPTLPSGLSCDFSTLPKPSSSANSPAITLLSDLGSGNLYYGTDEKSQNDGLCCHCGAPSTKEESNPQQLIYTLIHVVSRVLGLRTGQQLRYGLSGQLHFVVLPTSAIPDNHSATTMDNFGKEYTGPIRLVDADIFHLDYEWLLRCSQVRLLYVPHMGPPMLDTGESPEFSVQEFGQSEVSSTRPQIVPRNLSDLLTGQSVRSRLTRTKKASTNFGYLFGHFPANNHACCLTCLHAFYLSKRPKWSSSRGHKDDAYFLTWHSNTTEPFWFHHRPVGAASHPTCLDYWPELTERARQSPWQCTDCKTCTVCQNKQITTDLLVCDACDKGFHIECHVPKLEEPVDRSLPWVCAECQKEGYSVAIGTLPGESDSKYEDCTNFGTEEGGSLHHNEDEARCSQDENEANDESQLSETGTLRSSKVEDLREDQELALKGEARSLDRDAEVISPGTSPTPTPNYLSESNRLATPDSTVQSVSPAPEAPAMRQHTPQERCSSSDGQRSTPRQRRGSSSSEQSRTPDTGNCSRLDHNVKHLEQLTHTNTDESSTVRDQTTIDAYDTGDTGREFSQDTAHYRPPDVRAWSVEHVREWLLEEGFPREAEAFFQQEIDGACLLLMKRMDVLTELGIKLGPAVKIYERIKRLQSGCTSPTLLSA
ncbi:PHD-finger, partial [Opisthorchis viverrini]